MCISLIHFSFIISFLPLLRALTPIIHPTLTYLLLEVTTRVLLLYNSMNSAFGGGNGGSNPIHATITTANETYQLSQPVVESIVDDSLITGILDKAPHEDNQSTDEMYYTSTSVIQKLIQIAGISSRVQIAQFFPYYCLTDKEIQVRCAALESISHYPDLVYKYSNEILLRFECFYEYY